ncbi:MFS transporter [Nonomuraea recticatena]|uniref:MFS transporter n=1 Tax=Nonomuraea recticatena TaxID=46178 RepID=UPI003616B296
MKELARPDALVPALAGIAAGLAFGAGFVVRQLRLPEPLLDVRLFANRMVSGALRVFLLAATALGGVYLLFTQYLQLVEGLSPLQAGLWALPGAALLVVVSAASPVLARRIRPGYLIAAGLAVQVVGYLMLTQVDASGGLPLLVSGFMVLYPAVAPSMALTTNLIVGSVPPHKAGAASGLATTCSDLGISLGIAIIGSIGAAVYRAQAGVALPTGLPPEAATASRDSIDGAVVAAQQLPDDLGDALLTPPARPSPAASTWLPSPPPRSPLGRPSSPSPDFATSPLLASRPRPKPERGSSDRAARQIPVVIHVRETGIALDDTRRVRYQVANDLVHSSD